MLRGPHDNNTSTLISGSDGQKKMDPINDHSLLTPASETGLKYTLIIYMSMWEIFWGLILNGMANK